MTFSVPVSWFMTRLTYYPIKIWMDVLTYIWVLTSSSLLVISVIDETKMLNDETQTHTALQDIN